MDYFSFGKVIFLYRLLHEKKITIPFPLAESEEMDQICKAGHKAIPGALEPITGFSFSFRLFSLQKNFLHIWILRLLQEQHIICGSE
jgi:hypothetical protein